MDKFLWIAENKTTGIRGDNAIELERIYLPQDKEMQKEWVDYYVKYDPQVNSFREIYKDDAYFFKMMFLKMAVERDLLLNICNEQGIKVKLPK